MWALMPDIITATSRLILIAKGTGYFGHERKMR
jgi:hypothetical protein